MPNRGANNSPFGNGMFPEAVDTVQAQKVTPEASAAQNTDGYSPALFEFPVDVKDNANSRITFEIIEVRPPNFQVNFKSALNWLSFKTEQDRNRPGKSDIEAEPEFETPDPSVNYDVPREDVVSKVQTYKIIPTGKKVNLYVPQAHQITEVFNYNVPDLGAVGGGIMAGMEAGASASAAIKSAVSTGFAGVSELLSAVNGGTLGPLAAARAANAAPIGQGARNAVQLLARASLHPNQRAVFERPQIRRYSFQFKFIPKSREEADAIKQIITFFRFHAYPETLPIESGGFSIPIGYKHPDMFRIKIFHKVEPRNEDTRTIYLRDQISLIDSYLESISTNFNPTMAVYHADGTPVETDLTLNFMEHRALTREDIISDYRLKTAGTNNVPEDIAGGAPE